MDKLVGIYWLYQWALVACLIYTPSSSAEQYTGFVIIPQYYFPILSNFLNTTVP